MVHQQKTKGIPMDAKKIPVATGEPIFEEKALNGEDLEEFCYHFLSSGIIEKEKKCCGKL